MGRLIWTVFFGSANSPQAEKAHEVNLVMLLPLITLSLFSVFVGLNAYWPFGLGALIASDLDYVHHMDNYKSIHSLVLLLGSGAWVVGLGASFLFYGLNIHRVFDFFLIHIPNMWKFFFNWVFKKLRFIFILNKIYRFFYCFYYRCYKF